eukprot:2014517-Pyramimonas_sp.AAC.1
MRVLGRGCGFAVGRHGFADGGCGFTNAGVDSPMRVWIHRFPQALLDAEVERVREVEHKSADLTALTKVATKPLLSQFT